VEQIKATGVPMGMFPNASWREESVVMERGDLLCVYSDGITEALDAADEEFGLDRLTRRMSAEPPAKVCATVFDAVSAFAGDTPQYDDQTLLLLRRS